MINYFMGALSAWLLISVLYMVQKETCRGWMERFCECVICLPLMILAGIAVAMMYPIVFLWRFFRNAIKGVSVDCWKKARIKYYWKIGKLRICYDPEALRLINRLYLVRIVQPAEKIKHNPVKKS